MNVIMDVKTHVPHLPVTVDENYINEGALKILEIIRPKWKKGGIQFKLLTDGITNKLVSCNPENGDESDIVLVRVYGNKTDLLIDRKAETRNIILLNKLGLAPNLYATFENGLSYEFVPGCTLNENSVKEPRICKLVAQKMAKLHKVKLSDAEKPSPFIWCKLQQFFDLIPDKFTDEKTHKKFSEIAIPKCQIRNELNLLKEKLSDLDSPVVFAHNDLLLGNVIYTEKTNCVTFIDYEYAAYNYQAYDIANHFAEFAGLADVDYSRFPNKEFQYDWLRVYLQEFQEEEVTETDIEKLYIQVNKFVLLSHVFWGVWALIQAEHSYINFDYVGYFGQRFGEYLNNKDKFLSLEMP